MKRIKLLCTFILCSFGLLTAQMHNGGYHFKYNTNGKYQLVDGNNKKVKVKPFTFATEFSEGLAVVEKELKFAYIDTTGQTVIDYLFYDAGNFKEGLAYVSFGDDYGYINKKAELVIKPQFYMARDFEGGYAKVLKENPDTARYGKVNQLQGMINKKGELLGKRYFSSIRKIEEDNCFRARIKDSVFHVTLNGIVVLKEVKKQAPEMNENEGIMPQYPGGERALRQYIADNVRFPLSAQAYQLKARCFISFVVDKEGKVTEVYPARRTFPLYMKEGVRTVQAMPQWKPGIQNGEAVNVNYVVPFNFLFR